MKLAGLKFKKIIIYDMNMSKTIMGDQFLPITNTTEDFQRIILSEIEGSENHFDFNGLIARIRSKCEFKKEINTTYTGSLDFLGTELDFINKMIWEQIWNKKLMIDFTLNRPHRNPEMFYFIKINC